MTEDYYPYQAVNQKCQYDESVSTGVKVSSYNTVASSNVAQMKAALA
jgi:hypothetical protein